jgi:hypothetical protein
VQLFGEPSWGIKRSQFRRVGMSNSTEKPTHLRARMDRGGAKLGGVVSFLGGLGLLTQGWFISGAIIIYAGLIAFPATRVRASRGHLGFTKWRAYASRLLWMALMVIGLIAYYA